MDPSRIPPIMRRSPSPCPSPRHQMYHSTDTGHNHPDFLGVNTQPTPTNEERTRLHSQASQHSTGSYRMDESDYDDVENYSINHSNRRNMPSFVTPHREARMRRKLKFFFMNPCDKWRARRKCPWKLILQLVKIILVTAQLVMFGISRSSHVSFLDKSGIAFKHLYLENWNPSYETLPYPPATGVYAIYTIPEFYRAVDYALNRYNETEKLAIGTYHFSALNDSMPPIMMHNTHYKIGKIFAFNSTYYFDSEEVTDAVPLKPVKVYNETTKSYQLKYDVKKYLEGINKTINFDSFIRIKLVFSLKTVHLRSLSKVNSPDCYCFKITITYENSNHNGQVLVDLKVHETSLSCHGHVAYHNTNDKIVVSLASLFDVVVILISLTSLLLCVRSIYRAQRLKMEAIDFFRKYRNKTLSVWDRLEFLNMWYVLIIVNDILTISGSILKLEIENKVLHQYEACSCLLGTGNLLVWFGVLRYLGFFKKYNILILTLKKSAPNVLRFLACAAVFYLGFVFCGWVVLGPYHIKFRQLGTASQCLFALINGDDMFVTFASLQNYNQVVWWYSQFYLYLFISLFIYVVLSVFISVIMDTYETIKYCYEHGFPKSEMHEYIDQCTEDPSSALYRSDEASSVYGQTCCCFAGCQRSDEEDSVDVQAETSGGMSFSCCHKESTDSTPNEYSSLLHSPT